jgi:protein-disulfide isomerase
MPAVIGFGAMWLDSEDVDTVRKKLGSMKLWYACRWISCAVACSALSACGGPGVVSGSSRPADLTARELRDYQEQLAQLPSPCDKRTLLEACVESPGACKVCSAAARFVAHSIRSGFVPGEVEARYLARFDPDLVQVIDVEGAPSMGPSNAAVTVVEFADFQCPYCSALVPVLDGFVETYAPHVRVVFLDFPLIHHPQARHAAWAGLAAHQQGKFWELHHMMFAHADRLEKVDIDRYARTLNLDMGRFREDWDASATKIRVQANYDLGVRLGIRGVPALFVNGRVFEAGLFDLGSDDLEQWIELEIEVATGEPFKR